MAAGWATVPIANTGASIAVVNPIIASAGSVTGTAVGTINTDYVAVIDFVLKPTADGTFQVQGAVETGTTVVTYRDGSHIIVNEI